MPFAYNSKETEIKLRYTPLVQWNTSGVTSPIAKNKIDLFNFENKNNDGLVVEHNIKQQINKPKPNKEQDLQYRLAKIEQELKKAEDNNGPLGKAWSWFKNKTDGFLPVDSSNNVRKQLEIEKQKIKDIQKPEVFKELTGIEYSDENYQNLLDGKIKLLSEQKLEGYKEGQDMVVDVVADVAAGIGAGIAIAAAPVTGGASLLLAAGVGAVTKTAIKAASAGIRGKEYSGKNVLKDLGTGAITGLLTPVTMGAGGAAGNVTARVSAKLFGQSAAGKIASRATTFVAREGTVGAIFGGGAEGLGEVGRQGYHAIADGEDFDLGTIYEKTKEGTIGGAVAGVLMSGGIKGLSKSTKSLLCKIRSPKTCVKNIKFKNFEQVKNYSKKQIIKALKKKNPYERLTIINKDTNTLVALVEGKESEVNSDVLMLVNPLGHFTVEHGHPTLCKINGKPADPLSFNDYIAAIWNRGAEEIIAYDVKGNFSMLRKKPDFQKLDYKTIKHYEQILMKPLEDIYLKKMLACLPKEYQSVKSKEELFSIYDQLIECGKLTSELNLKFLKGIEETEKITPKELYIIDKFWRTHADDLGVIYETNYEYLKNL